MLKADCGQETFDMVRKRKGETWEGFEDSHVHTTGLVGEHNVILAYIPGMGTISTAAGSSLLVSIPNIKLTGGGDFGGDL